jgi:hypothetical protein
MPFVQPAGGAGPAPTCLAPIPAATSPRWWRPRPRVADRSNPDVVKAVLAMQRDGLSGRALYFTRSTLYGDAPVWRHHRHLRLSPRGAGGGSTPPRRRRWRSARSWSSCGRWSWACRSGPPSSTRRRSASTIPPTSNAPGRMQGPPHEQRTHRLPGRARRQQPQACLRGLSRHGARAAPPSRRPSRPSRKGDCQLGMIPVENSIAGRVADVHHLLPRRAEDHRRAVQADPLPADGQPGVKLEDGEDATMPIALGQCRKTSGR